MSEEEKTVSTDTEENKSASKKKSIKNTKVVKKAKRYKYYLTFFLVVALVLAYNSISKNIDKLLNRQEYIIVSKTSDGAYTLVDSSGVKHYVDKESYYSVEINDRVYIYSTKEGEKVDKKTKNIANILNK